MAVLDMREGTGVGRREGGEGAGVGIGRLGLEGQRAVWKGVRRWKW